MLHQAIINMLETNEKNRELQQKNRKSQQRIRRHKEGPKGNFRT